MKKKTNIVEKIVKIVNAHKKGITIAELCRKAKITRLTFYYHLWEVLPRIEMRKYGRTKVLFPKKHDNRRIK